MLEHIIDMVGLPCVEKYLKKSKRGVFLFMLAYFDDIYSVVEKIVDK